MFITFASTVRANVSTQVISSTPTVFFALKGQHHKNFMVALLVVDVQLVAGIVDNFVDAFEETDFFIDEVEE